MIEQAKLNQAFFARYGDLSFLEGIASWAEPSRASFPKSSSQNQAEPSQASAQTQH